MGIVSTTPNSNPPTRVAATDSESRPSLGGPFQHRPQSQYPSNRGSMPSRPNELSRANSTAPVPLTSAPRVPAASTNGLADAHSTWPDSRKRSFEACANRFKQIVVDFSPQKRAKTQVVSGSHAPTDPLLVSGVTPTPRRESPSPRTTLASSLYPAHTPLVAAEPSAPPANPVPRQRTPTPIATGSHRNRENPATSTLAGPTLVGPNPSRPLHPQRLNLQKKWEGHRLALAANTASFGSLGSFQKYPSEPTSTTEPVAPASPPYQASTMTPPPQRPHPHDSRHHGSNQKVAREPETRDPDVGSLVKRMLAYSKHMLAENAAREQRENGSHADHASDDERASRVNNAANGDNSSHFEDASHFKTAYLDNASYFDNSSRADPASRVDGPSRNTTASNFDNAPRIDTTSRIENALRIDNALRLDNALRIDNASRTDNASRVDIASRTDNPSGIDNSSRSDTQHASESYPRPYVSDVSNNSHSSLQSQSLGGQPLGYGPVQHPNAITAISSKLMSAAGALAPSPDIVDVAGSRSQVFRSQIGNHTDLNSLRSAGSLGQTLPHRPATGAQRRTRSNFEQLNVPRASNGPRLTTPDTQPAPYSTPLEPSSDGAHTKASEDGIPKVRQSPETRQLAKHSSDLLRNPSAQQPTASLGHEAQPEPSKQRDTRWTELQWRHFSIAMRDSMISANVTGEQVLVFFKELRGRLPSELKQMSLEEAIKRLDVWVKNTGTAALKH